MYLSVDTITERLYEFFGGVCGVLPYQYSDIFNPRNRPLSPVLVLPKWIVDNRNYTITPLSSPRIYTPGDVKPQHYFGRLVSEVLQPPSMTSSSIETLQPSPLSVLQADTNQDQTQESIQPAPAYVPLSLIHNPQTERSPSPDITEGPLPSRDLSVTFKRERAPLPQYKAVWGTEKEPSSKQHSDYRRSRSRRESLRGLEKRQNPLKGLNVPAISNGRQLRSMRTGQKISYFSQEDDPRTKTTNPRTSHNIVEKRYRTRLNGQFSMLLEVLPPDWVSAEVGGYRRDGSGGAEKVSKAEVLMLAKRHIETLEREKRGLEDENRALMEDMRALKGAWVGMGGRFLS
ncbi:hypothetical protein BGZ60DRAFT_400501 [Tricladium varicosporioides]|nr:hypothetical protein BGZ60DRAFT_400501 [Hymenoscyphus varicosporioides]